MKTSSILFLALWLLTGCASRTWIETTETTRATGPTTESVENRRLSNEYFELRTDLEPDGFTINETLTADDEGRIVIDLLAPALQCLHYGHDVQLELWSYDDTSPVYTRALTAEQSRDVIREISVQTKLGEEILLRRKSASMLDRVIDAAPDQELRDQLEAIRLKLKIRLAWE
ncbi:MAG: hypothetical protein R3E76_01685 [Planctomycetota bacterium]